MVVVDEDGGGHLMRTCRSPSANSGPIFDAVVVSHAFLFINSISIPAWFGGTIRPHHRAPL